MVYGMDKKYLIEELTRMGHIESALFKSDVYAVCRCLHPYTNRDIFRSGATMAIYDVGQGGQGFCNPRHNQGVKKISI